MGYLNMSCISVVYDGCHAVSADSSQLDLRVTLVKSGVGEQCSEVRAAC